jgi:RNA polymerase sigma-70 factor (ECF subfamily)
VTSSGPITVLLHRLRDGDQSVLDELMPLVYGELRRIAGAFMRGQQPCHTLQPTALVNEAFIKLFDGHQPRLLDRAHMLALMSRVMRQVLIDHARTVGAAKRGGGVVLVSWDANMDPEGEGIAQQTRVLALHDALDALARDDADLAAVVEMHYFGGMTAEEIAMVVGRSVHVVRHDLRLARAWLRRDLSV